MPFSLRCCLLMPVTGLALAVTFCPALNAADPPKIERLFPPGGQVGTSVEVKVHGAAGEGVPELWSDHGQLTIAFTEKKDAATVTIPNDAKPGVHWLRFYNAAGATDLRPFLVGLVPEVAEVEPNDEPEKAQKIEALPVTITGVLEKSQEVDVYGVQVKAGQTLVASMVANQQLASPMDAVLQILGEDGAVIAANDDDHGFDPLIALDVPEDATWYVRTFAFPAAPNSTIKLAGAANYVYRLTVSVGPVVHHTLPAVAAADTETTVQLKGWNIPDAMQSATVPATSAALPAWLTENLTLPVRLEMVERPSVHEESVSDSTLPVPSTVTGSISEPGEVDVYRFDAKKGQELSFTVAARAHHSLLDPVVAVRSADGKVIREVDDRSSGKDLDADASVKIPSDGVYTVEITDRFGTAGARHFYILTAQETLPSAKITLKENALLLPEEKPLEIAVTIARENGFAEPLTISIQGLPEHITAEPVVSEPKGETSKAVTLKVTRTAEATAFSGVIQVVASGKEGTAQVVAQAPIANSSQTTSDIWLTVAAPKEVKPEEKPAEKDPAKAESEPAK